MEQIVAVEPFVDPEAAGRFIGLPAAQLPRRVEGGLTLGRTYESRKCELASIGLAEHGALATTSSGTPRSRSGE